MSLLRFRNMTIATLVAALLGAGGCSSFSRSRPVADGLQPGPTDARQASYNEPPDDKGGYLFTEDSGADDPSTAPQSAGGIKAFSASAITSKVKGYFQPTRSRAEGRRLFDLTRVLFPVVLPVTAEVMDRARILLETYPHLMAREGLHAAVVLQHQLDGLCSFDRDFDAVAGVERVEP